MIKLMIILLDICGWNIILKDNWRFWRTVVGVYAIYAIIIESKNYSIIFIILIKYLLPLYEDYSWCDEDYVLCEIFDTVIF